MFFLAIPGGGDLPAGRFAIPGGVAWGRLGAIAFAIVVLLTLFYCMLGPLGAPGKLPATLPPGAPGTPCEGGTIGIAIPGTPAIPGGA
jgi:hypothetical protein